LSSASLRATDAGDDDSGVVAVVITVVAVVGFAVAVVVSFCVGVVFVEHLGKKAMASAVAIVVAVAVPAAAAVSAAVVSAAVVAAMARFARSAAGAVKPATALVSSRNTCTGANLRTRNILV
jgi:hypothetical protein